MPCMDPELLLTLDSGEDLGMPSKRRFLMDQSIGVVLGVTGSGILFLYSCMATLEFCTFQCQTGKAAYLEITAFVF